MTASTHMAWDIDALAFSGHPTPKRLLFGIHSQNVGICLNQCFSPSFVIHSPPDPNLQSDFGSSLGLSGSFEFLTLHQVK